MKSKLLVALLVSVGLIGCASKEPPPAVIQIKNPETVARIKKTYEDTRPIYELRNYEGPEALDNSEVVSGARQCISVQMKPKINYLNIRTDSGSLKIPVSVSCENW